MKVDDYFLPAAANHEDLSVWARLLPRSPRVFRTNLFGDAFIIDDAGGIHILERPACTSRQIAKDADEFWKRLLDDEDGWQLRPLVRRCQSEGLFLGADQCYAFKTPPVAGGTYTPDNIWIASWAEWFALMGSIYDQVKDLADGTKVRIKIVD